MTLSFTLTQFHSSWHGKLDVAGRRFVRWGRTGAAVQTACFAQALRLLGDKFPVNVLPHNSNCEHPRCQIPF